MSDHAFDRFPRTLAAICAGIDSGLHRGVQIYVSRHGDALLDAALGDAAPGRAMTVQTIHPWLSCGKPLTAALLGMLCERGGVDWDAPLSKVLTEWKSTPKAGITLAHVLTHTSGLTEVDAGGSIANWDVAVARAIDAPLVSDGAIGMRAAYSAATGWFLAGEVIRRVSGRPFDRVLRDDLLVPLGLTSTWCGMTSDEYDAVRDRIGHMFTRAPGGLVDLDWHLPERCLPASPGGNARGPIRELGRFYEAFLGVNRSESRRLWSPQTVAALTARRRIGMFDETFRHAIDWGLGVIVDSQRYGSESLPYSFGPCATERAFGHGGSQSSLGFADPETGLVVAWVANGRVGEPRHQQRNREFNAALCADLSASA